MTFLYIHGFNSDGDGWKAQALQRQFPEARVLAPDLAADPRLVQHQLTDICSSAERPMVLVGTSLGGFYAYCNSAYSQLPALLFNPSLRPYETLSGRGIGTFKTWTKGREYHFKEAYLPLLAAMKEKADLIYQPKLIRVFLAEDDELLDHSKITTQLPEVSIQWHAGAGHSFSKFEKVLKSIKKEAWL